MTSRLGTYAGIFLQAFWIILFEITLTKIFSVTMWYHFGYMSISLAMLGLGAGGVFTYVRKDDPKEIGLVLGAQLVSTVFAVLLIANVPSPKALEHISRLAIFLACFVPFFCGGIYLSSQFKASPSLIGRLYFSDLLGSAVGCLAFALLIGRLSGPALALASALVPAAILGVGLRNGPRPLERKLAFGGAALVLALLAFSGTYRLKYTKTYKERPDVVTETWSTLSRVTVYPSVFFQEGAAFGWGMSRRAGTPPPQTQHWLEQDGSAGTPITKFNGDPATLAFLKYDITAFPYHIVRPKKVFIVGTGGGRDLLTALYFGASSIAGCEIHDEIVRLMRGPYASFSGNLYGLPQVKVENLDARSCIKRASDRYDLIQLSLIDSWSATTAGAFAMTENSLYTVEAFRDYLEKLTDDGVLAVSRFLFTPRNQTLRVSSLARAALESMGVTDVGRHVVVVATDFHTGTSTTLIKKSPFTPKELKDVERYLSDFQFTNIYRPDLPTDDAFSKVLTAPDFESALASFYYDVSPTTDNRPYFFQVLRFHQIFDTLAGKTGGQSFNNFAHVALAATFLFCLVMLAFFFYLPMKRAGVTPLSLPWRSYFALLGLGFMFVEIPVIQMGSLILGHPTYGLTVGLFSLLIATGLGSLTSDRTGRWNGYRLGAIFGCALFLLAMELSADRLLGASFLGRVTGYGILVFGVGFTLGGFLPWGLKRIGESQPDHVSWAWAINGAASVLGSVLAVALSMELGYTQAIGAGLICYLAALATTSSIAP